LLHAERHRARLIAVSEITVGGRASAETGGSQHFAMLLNNYLQRRFGATMREYIRWDIASTGPQNAITCHCTVYSGYSVTVPMRIDS
jgi:hypothetical protein